MSICSLDPPDLSRNCTADIAHEHWGRRGSGSVPNVGVELGSRG